MTSKRSPIWNYFEEDPANYTNARCTVPGCRDPVISRGKDGVSKSRLGTTALTNHLEKHHKKESNELKALKLSENENRKRKCDEEENQNEMESSSVSKLRNKGEREKFLDTQRTLGSFGFGVGKSESIKYKNTDPRAKERHRAVLMEIIMDVKPFEIVLDPGWNHLVRTLDSHFEPGSDKFYRDLVGKVYENSVKRVQEKILQDNPDDVSVQLDGWSFNGNSYIGIIINYITANWKRVSLNIACKKLNESHSGENMAALLTEVLEEWKVLDKTHVMISDSASNMRKILDYLPLELDVSLVRCLNHILNTVVTNNILEGAEIKKKLETIRRIVTFSHKSTLFAEAMRKEFQEAGQTSLKLIQDVQTRWNSTYDMLLRFLQVKSIIKGLLNKGWGKEISGKDKPEIKISDRDWNLLAAVTKVLRGFKEATENLSKASACVSEYIPTVFLLLKSIEVSAEDETEIGRGVKGLKTRLSDDLEKRMREMDIERLDTFVLATLLDPRFKGNFFRSDEAKKNGEKKLLELLKEKNNSEPELLSSQSPPNSVSDSIEDTSALHSIYAEMKKKAGQCEESEEVIISSYLNSGLENSNLLFWSQLSKSEQPIKKSLCKLARKFLTPHPTSTNVERLFSTAGNIVRDRGSLKPENVEKLVFLKENLRMQNFPLDW